MSTPFAAPSNRSLRQKVWAEEPVSDYRRCRVLLSNQAVIFDWRANPEKVRLLLSNSRPPQKKLQRRRPLVLNLKFWAQKPKTRPFSWWMMKNLYA